MGKSDYCVFIGRFQPMHNGHWEIIKNALDNEAHKLVLVVGSYRTPKSLSNPWSYQERVEMIKSAIPKSYLKRMVFVPARDYLYSDTTWTVGIQSAVSSVVPNGSSVKIIGHFKDASSYYLKMFPQWSLVSEPNFQGINSTTVRNELFETGGFNPCLVPIEVAETLADFTATSTYKDLVREYNFLKGYKKQWESAPFPPVFVTSDAVVVQSGHILMVKRGFNPGAGMYALPGGFVNPNEHILDSCLRELKEETNIVYPKRDLRNSLTDVHVFDHPNRDKRGRTITHAHYFNLTYLGPLPEVQGGDDAAEALWLPLSDLPLVEENIYSDHLHIVNYFVNNIGRQGGV